MAAMERTFNAEESTLCEKCSVLRINDRELAIHKVQNNDGEHTSGVSFVEEFFQQELNYIHADLLPDLPYLRDTADAGCAFCAILRSAALELAFVKPAGVTFTLQYCWRLNEIPRYWVCALQAFMRVEDGEPESYTTWRAGIFEVDCKEGDTRPDLLDVLSDCTR